MKKSNKQTKKTNEKISDKFESASHTMHSHKAYEHYETQFQEDVVHQLWHLVEEVKGVKEKISKFNQVVSECNKSPLISKEELLEFISKHIKPVGYEQIKKKSSNS